MPLLGQIEEAHEPPDGLEDVRAWWAGVVKRFETYQCYATFLMLPSDNEAAEYLRKYRDELQQITGKMCLFLVFKGPDLDVAFSKRKITSAEIERVFMDGVLSGAKKLGPGYQAHVADLALSYWSVLIKAMATKGTALNLAAAFKVPFESMPCLLLFRDVRRPHHVLVPLRGMTTEQIAETMRETFTK